MKNQITYNEFMKYFEPFASVHYQLDRVTSMSRGYYHTIKEFTKEAVREVILGFVGSTERGLFPSPPQMKNACQVKESQSGTEDLGLIHFEKDKNLYYGQCQCGGGFFEFWNRKGETMRKCDKCGEIDER